MEIRPRQKIAYQKLVCFTHYFSGSIVVCRDITDPYTTTRTWAEQRRHGDNSLANLCRGYITNVADFRTHNKALDKKPVILY